MAEKEFITKLAARTAIENYACLDCVHSDGKKCEDCEYQDCINFINEVKAADVQPVKRGYWKDIMMSEATGWDLSLTGGRDAVLETVCSVCGNCCAFGGDGEDYLSPYCPNCGARMDKS